MRHLLILFSLCLTMLTASSQKKGTWKTDSSYNDYYSKTFLSKLDTTKFSNSDLQIWLWFSNGSSTLSLLSLNSKNKIWDAVYFTFSKNSHPLDTTIKINQKEVLKLNLDSLYKVLVKDSLLTLRSDAIGRILDEKGHHSWSWTDSGPTVYLIEIITPSKKWSLRYPFPKYFYEQYKIEQFKTPLKLITSLLFLLGISPC